MGRNPSLFANGSFFIIRSIRSSHKIRRKEQPELRLLPRKRLRQLLIPIVLQKATQNPVASLISVPIQNNSNFGIGPNAAPRTC